MLELYCIDLSSSFEMQHPAMSYIREELFCTIRFNKDRVYYFNYLSISNFR